MKIEEIEDNLQSILDDISNDIDEQLEIKSEIDEGSAYLAHLKFDLKNGDKIYRKEISIDLVPCARFDKDGVRHHLSLIASDVYKEFKING